MAERGGGGERGGFGRGFGGGRPRGDTEGVAVDVATRRALPWTPRRGGRCRGCRDEEGVAVDAATRRRTGFR
uniref:Uncharacterized protein n=1 Tax=Fagus sylvatica TaxID=28930 RepID=A0A2N9FJV9_FAGSY